MYLWKPIGSKIMENDFKPSSLNQWLRSWVGFALNLLHYAWKGIRHYGYLYLLIFGIFTALFYFHSRNIRSHYEAVSSYTYLHAPKKVYGDMLYDLQLLVEAQQSELVSGMLGVGENASRSLRSIGATNLINKPLHEDYTTKTVPFYIHVKVDSDEYLTEIQNGITAFLNSNSFAKKKESERIKVEQRKLEELNFQVGFVDSLLNTYKGESDTTNLAEWMQFKFDKEIAKYAIEQSIIPQTPVNLLKAFKPIFKNRSEVIFDLAKYYALVALCFSGLITTVLYWYNQNG